MPVAATSARPPRAARFASSRCPRPGCTCYLPSSTARDSRPLRGAPTHADPPAAVDATAQTHNRYLHLADAGIACIGEAPPPDGGCDGEYGSCDGELCVASDGFVSVAGRWAPGDTTFGR